MKKITPFLWFNDQAEQAVNFYVSVFKNSKVTGMSRYGEGAPFPKGTVMSASFTLDGQEFIALNAGPQFKFTEAISFLIRAETQEEIDELWTKLIADGGTPQPCGWLKDKFGLSWQVVPPILEKYLGDNDPEKARRVMTAMLKMTKIEIPKLQDAYDSK